ncbi:hypothetical protein KVR01_013464 [Diaporthe batatas]|uniref:uncharacterized protein n=1 Tax=Diaporthe batatas TaxID=748121 RepID=UPI001D036DE5|nr:uncharacterized protein KVR01_013464 [Diaporthe batatas]KAG8156673.1 hypothetical protein KVR01_013464 [Diaporthe batatas]
MASGQSTAGDDATGDFFERCGLPRESCVRCWDLARHLFPDECIAETKPQGYCSYTLSVGGETILQFRPEVHRLDIRITTAAQTIYGSLAPPTKSLDVLNIRKSCHSDGIVEFSHQQPVDEAVVIDDGCSKSYASLHVYSMARIPGISVAELRASSELSTLPAAELRRRRQDVVSEFARFVAVSWSSALPASDPTVSRIRGRIGGSIRWRLQQMHARLPARFQSSVGSVLDQLDGIESLPWVLTHGDVVPANMMVQNPQDASSGAVVLSGFLDWAEAEYLPFGVGMYGLEALLGEPDCEGRFGYYSEAKELRECFWTRLEAEMPELRLRSGAEGFREKVEAAHVIGVLLWHGIAFDNGRLDRVVDESNPEDAEEVRILDLFFSCDEESRDEQLTSAHPLRPGSNGSAKAFDLGRVIRDAWACLGRLNFGDRRMTSS